MDSSQIGIAIRVPRRFRRAGKVFGAQAQRFADFGEGEPMGRVRGCLGTIWGQRISRGDRGSP